MTGFLNLTEVASKRKTMIPENWYHGLNLMMLYNTGSFFIREPADFIDKKHPMSV